MINKFKHNHLHYLVTVLIFICITSCSGENSDIEYAIGDDSILKPVSPVPVSPVIDTPKTELLNDVSFEALFNADMEVLFKYNDRDGDGIHDNVDIYPDTAPSYRDPVSSQELAIERVWTEIEEQAIPDAAVENYLLKVSGAGLSESATNTDSWLVFMTDEGLRAKRAKFNNDGSMSVMPPLGASSVHVVIGLSRSSDVPLSYHLTSAPVLYGTDLAYSVGSEITLSGRNLENINEVVLAADDITLIASTTNSITFRLPDIVSGNQLTLLSGNVRSNTLKLNIRHNVSLSLSTELTLQSGDYLSIWYENSRYQIDASQTQTISLPAYKPVALFFDVVKASGDFRYYSRVAALAWPDSQSIQISPATTLIANLVNMRSILPDSNGKSWQQLRRSLKPVLSFSSASTFYSELQNLLANATSFSQEQRIVEVIAEYRVSLNLPSTKIYQPMLAKTTSSGDQLDDVVGATVTYEGEGADADAPNGGDYVYPRETLGNDYSQFVIVPHSDIRLVNRSLQFFNSVCNFSPEEQTNKPGILWDSDLCLQIDGLTFASVAVYKPGLLGTSSYQPKTADRVRRHASGSFLDTKYLWGPGGHYLLDDKNRALCNMESCYVEVISSGYGLGYKVNLTELQQQLVSKLRARMWLEGIIPAMIKMAGIATGSARTCLFNEARKSGELYNELDNLQDRIKANSNKTSTDLVNATVDAVDQTLGKWARNFVKNESNLAFYNCVKNEIDPAKRTQAAFDSMIKQALDEVAGSLFKFADILVMVTDLGSAVLTPEKFVFRMDSRARIIGVAPKVIDLFNTAETFDILGSWIAEKPCGTDQGWCPEVLFRDRFGKEFSYKISESEIVPPISDVGVGGSQISIPLTALKNGLGGLSSGPVKMKLVIRGTDYESYIDKKFKTDSYKALPIPLPDDVLELKSLGKLVAFDPPLAQPGEIVKALGDRLDQFGNMPVYELEDISGLFPARIERIGTSLEADKEVILQLPVNAFPGQYRLTIKPDPAADSTTANRQPLVSVSTLLISSGTKLPAVIIGDYGLNKDDSMVAELFDILGSPVRDTTNTFAPLNIVIPTELRLPAGRYTDGLYWDDSDIPATGIDSNIEQIKITCSDGGGDDTCTYGIRMLRDTFCAPGWTTPRTSYSGKILEDKSITFYVALKEDFVADCSLVLP